MKRIAKFLAIAELAAKRSNSKFLLGAAIAKGQSLVSVGTNDMLKTHPLISLGGHARIHAEVDACIGIRRERLIGCTIYVYRIRRLGDMGMAKPCPACQRILSTHGIRRAYYSDPSSIIGYNYIDF